ncbi:hypothetical protein GCM10008171_22650 [Methylopila jiangsuensis]|uniref:DUF1150 domain-containing protein n=1 Tax=Methylopila jiangsuensis TaxID=586230 RepID=A0A9W6JG71_9HYPH|nr:DUF1150 domain-containing protein [Methylopila jiangsuensis]MDR6286647.1 hypothetical protein [Methylopila jiangsuensis]GLK77011.1 hypothetical protein GCM10008171_22650 [Methylopila jiangsuensis]
MVNGFVALARKQPLTAAEFAAVGDGRIAYVKPMQSEQLNALFPEAPELEPGLALFALLGADGSPIVVADSREALIESAREHELVTVAVH